MRFKKTLFQNSSFLIFLLFFFTLPSAVLAATYVDGEISADTTWTLANSPYVVLNKVIVNPGVILTLSIKGVDDITVDPEELCFKSKKETICQIQDEAGNITKLIFDKLKEEGKEIKAELKSVQYNNQPLIIFPKAELKYEWSIDKKSGEIKNLEQKINIKDQFDIQAKYNDKKDETKVKIKLQGEKEQEQILPGVIIIKLITKSGILDFKF